MRHQTVNLRAGSVLVFGSDEQQRAYEQECHAARKAQTTRYAIAPRQSLKLHDGRMLNAGAEVIPERDFVLRTERIDHGGPREASLTLPVWRQLEQLVFRGVILEADHAETTPDPEAA